MMISKTNSDTIATLVKKNGNFVTESDLRITVSAVFSTASITCIDVGHKSSSIIFQLLGIPDKPRNVTVKKIASVPDGDCVVLIQWMPPSIALSSVQYYVVNSPSGSSIARNTSIALLIHHCVLDTHISVHAVDYCDRDGPSTDIHVNILSQVLEVPDVKSTSVPTGTGLIYHPERSRSSHGNSAIIGAVLGGSLPISIIVLIITGVTCW